MKVYCIVITHNGSEWIEKCFDSLCKSTVPLTIIVIDNASSDNTVTLIKENFPLIHLIENTSNIGFGQANNIGLKMALKENADYVFLLNQDAWIESDTLQKLLSISCSYAQYGIVAPFHLNYEGNKIENYFNDYVISQYTPGYISDLYKGNLKPIYTSAFIHAAGWLIPNKVLKDVGGFDPLFSHYGEDNDYVQRLQAKKYLVGLVPDAVMYHKGTNDSPANLSVNERHKMNFALLRFKQPSASMAGSTLVFLKSSFDGITSALLYRRFKSLKMEGRIFFKVIKQFGKIARSRKLQAVEAAYLN